MSNHSNPARTVDGDAVRGQAIGDQAIGDQAIGDQAIRDQAIGDDARVLVYSQRNSNRLIWQTTTYEFEDIIAEVDRAHLMSPRPRELSTWQERAAGIGDRLAGRLWSRKVPRVWPAAVERDYELFFAVFQFAYQLPLLREVRDWRRRCGKAVCLLNELWRPTIAKNARFLALLEEFDHVFLINRSSVEPLSRLIKTPVSFLPMGIEAQRLSPYPDPQPRFIDCYAMGRRSPAVHAALVDLVERERLTYVYDTARGNRVYDYREHRLMAATLARSSRYFFSFRINDNAERFVKTGGEEGLAMRFFEGAAAGAVLLGSRPNCPEHDECFDWPDSTIDVAFDGSDVRRVMAELDAQPERVARVRRDNIVNSLRRHDWLYRWQRVLEVAGLEPTPGMARRAARLEELAQLALADHAAPARERACAALAVTHWSMPVARAASSTWSS